jgi:hypothetical protein
MNKICAIHQPHYLPYMGYFDKIFQSDVFIFLDTVQFERGGWQNRNKIRTLEESKWLTIPVLSKKMYQNIGDTKIDMSQTTWKRKHLQLIKLNYSKAKHFERYWIYLRKLYLETNIDNLSLFNLRFIKWLITALIPDWKGEFVVASEHEGISDEPTRRLIDLCRKFNCDIYLSGSGGQSYMNMNLFIDAGVTVKWQRFEEREYEQCYMPFLSGMCCLDYLLNCGRWK